MRPIDADALQETMYHEAFEKDSDLQKWDSGCWIRYKLFEKCIDAAPTIEPKRGKWEDVEDVLYEGITDGTPYTVTAVGYKCSVCGTEMGTLWSFCPNCGARMDVADNDVGKMDEVEDEHTD